MFGVLDEDVGSCFVETISFGSSLETGTSTRLGPRSDATIALAAVNGTEFRSKIMLLTAADVISLPLALEMLG